jgi:hypothetical protein
VGVLAVRFVLDAVSAWKSLLAGEGRYFMAVLKAHGSFMVWLFSSKQKNLFPPVRKGTLTGWFPGSIIWQYFVRGKRKFSEIQGQKSG